LLGEVDPGVLDGLGITERVAVLEVDLGLLLDLRHGRQAYEPVSRYPSSDIDLAFVVPDAVPAGEVRGAIREAAGELLVSLRLFDVFRNESLPAGTRSLAFTLRLQASDHTLTDEETADVRSTVIAAVESPFDAKLRA
jgi:phenylalanyl-tRNA synthetase beta chain